jgi:hypothetical protein
MTRIGSKQSSIKKDSFVDVKWKLGGILNVRSVFRVGRGGMVDALARYALDLNC